MHIENVFPLGDYSTVIQVHTRRFSGCFSKHYVYVYPYPKTLEHNRSSITKYYHGVTEGEKYETDAEFTLQQKKKNQTTTEQCTIKFVSFICNIVFFGFNKKF